jgi:diguanylate cyclase (GGDEF)-like protein
VLRLVSRLRSVLAVVAIVAVLLGLGSLAFTAQRSAGATAQRVHRDDRIQLQSTLAGLTRQYLMLSFGELNTLAVQPGWQLSADSAADRTRLAEYVRSSPLIGAGAAVVSLSGAPLTQVAANGTELPPPSDPGYDPLRAELRAGGPGLSSLMAVGGRQLIAFGVPISIGGVPAAVLVGYADATTWPLQTYVASLDVGEHAETYVLDAAGVAVAASASEEVGHQIAGLPAAATATTAIEDFSADGTDTVASRGPVGFAGWQSVTTQPASAYDGALTRQHTQAQLALLALLLLVSLLAVWAFVIRFRRLATEARRATFDPLTGLPQRRLLMAHLEAALARARRVNAPLALFYGDLDGFKAVNDTHGHRRGDALLVEVGNRLRDAVRAEDFVARLGGDEFVIVAEGITLADAATLAERLIERVNRPIELDRATVHVGITLGGIRTSSGDVPTVLEAGDTAMYDAKRMGKAFVIRELGALAHLAEGETYRPGRDDRPAPAPHG